MIACLYDPITLHRPGKGTCDGAVGRFPSMRYNHVLGDTKHSIYPQRDELIQIGTPIGPGGKYVKPNGSPSMNVEAGKWRIEAGNTSTRISAVSESLPKAEKGHPTRVRKARSSPVTRNVSLPDKFKTFNSYL